MSLIPSDTSKTPHHISLSHKLTTLISPYLLFDLRAVRRCYIKTKSIHTGPLIDCAPTLLLSVYNYVLL